VVFFIITAPVTTCEGARPHQGRDAVIHFYYDLHTNRLALHLIVNQSFAQNNMDLRQFAIKCYTGIDKKKAAHCWTAFFIFSPSC
jgi:hypothetical protein